MIDEVIILDKMSEMQGYLEEIEPYLAKSISDIAHEKSILRSVERLFQLIVDTALAINAHIIAEKNLPIPSDYQSTFITLAQSKIFPMEFAYKIAPSVGLRNLIIHKYGEVNLMRMIEDIKADIADYYGYLDHIDSFLKNLSE